METNTHNARPLPRLTALLQWQGILSVNEARSAILAYRAGDRRFGGSEAVVHYGGAGRLVADAVARRRSILPLVARYERTNDPF